MNALKKSLRTLVTLITLLVCLSSIQGAEFGYESARKEAERGDASAQCYLALRYYKGVGVPQDYVLAYMWFNLASASAHEGANTSREFVSKRMTPEQIAEAQKLSREWKPKGR